MGLSQSNIDKLLNVTYQQVQKYENGVSRLGVEKVKILSDHFELPISYFFTEYQSAPQPMTSQQIASEVAHLISMFLRLEDPESRDKIVRMAHELLDQQVKGSMRLVPKTSD
jgi:transcriptional regulator with XRE-family HTH domain